MHWVSPKGKVAVLVWFPACDVRQFSLLVERPLCVRPSPLFPPRSTTDNFFPLQTSADSLVCWARVLVLHMAVCKKRERKKIQKVGSVSYLTYVYENPTRWLLAYFFNKFQFIISWRRKTLHVTGKFVQANIYFATNYWHEKSFHGRQLLHDT